MHHDQAIHSGAPMISADRVKGTAVYDTAGTKIGSIDSVMIRKVGGQVAYAIMSFGGFLGIGEQYHPLPWDSLDYDTDLDGYRVAMSADDLRAAPNYDRAGVDSADWGQTTDDYYAGSRRSVYGSAPASM